MFDKRPQRDTRGERIVHQALDVFKRHQSLVSHDVHEEMSRRIEEIRQELIRANQAAPSGLTLLRLETNMAVLAQSMGLLVWEYWGQCLSQEDCVALAQANAIIELYIQRKKIPAGNRTYEWYNKAIAEQVLATQASTPVVLCFMGQEDQARRMVAASLEAAKLPTDEEIAQAVQQISAG